MNTEHRIDIAEIEKLLTPSGYNDERDVFEMGEWAAQYGQLLIDYIRKMDAQLDKLNQVAEAVKAWAKTNQYPGPLREVHKAESEMLKALEELEEKE